MENLDVSKSKRKKNVKSCKETCIKAYGEKKADATNTTI